MKLNGLLKRISTCASFFGRGQLLPSPIALCLCGLICAPVRSQTPVIGDAPVDPGPRASLRASTDPDAVRSAVRLVADWQLTRVKGNYSQEWTYATLYAGLMAASRTLRDDRYQAEVTRAGQHFHWTLGPDRSSADDQAIGQAYLELYKEHPDLSLIEPIRQQYRAVMQLPDDPAKDVWWWCDALFMAPPVLAKLSQVTGDTSYDVYMDREWKITDKKLWDDEEHLFYRDASYFDKREKNGAKVFWSRGNGWVMGGLVRVLEVLPRTDPSYDFYTERFRQMSAKIITLQRRDGLWSPGLLNNDAYALPEVSGSSFYVYALAWGINHGLLDARSYRPAVDRAWAGLVANIYADGRLGSIQPVGAAPGDFIASSSYVFGTGAFMLAGSEVVRLPAAGRARKHK